MSTIKARFKAANVKDGDNATLQFDVSTKADGFIDAIQMIGEKVDLSIEYEQTPLPLVYETEKSATESVDVEDVCDYDAIADERGLPVGGDADE